MKRTLTMLTSALLIHACKSDLVNHNEASVEPIKPGIEILADSVPIAEDKLNNQYFGIHIYTNDSSVNGSYDVQTTWGYNIATTTIRMPYGAEHLQPILRRASSPYTFIIGFHFDDDTAFNEYYQIQGSRGEIKARYVKSYTFE